MEKRRKHMTDAQKELLISFMEKHGDIGSIHLKTPEGREKKRQLKEELANLLNSQEGGVTRSASEWIHTWNDHKSKAKSKAAAIRRYESCSDGGPTEDAIEIPPLTPWEERIVSILSPELITGYKHNVVEAGVIVVAPPASSSPPAIGIDEQDLRDAGHSETIIIVKEEPLSEHLGTQTPHMSDASTPESLPRRRKRRRVSEPLEEFDGLNRFVNAEETNRGRFAMAESIANGQREVANAISIMATAVRDGLQAIANSQQALAESLTALAEAIKK